MSSDDWQKLALETPSPPPPTYLAAAMAAHEKSCLELESIRAEATKARVARTGFERSRMNRLGPDYRLLPASDEDAAELRRHEERVRELEKLVEDAMSPELLARQGYFSAQSRRQYETTLAEQTAATEVKVAAAEAVADRRPLHERLKAILKP